MSLRSKIVWLASLVAVSLVLGSQPVSAYDGTGYNSLQYMCTTNAAGTRDCGGGTISASQNNVIPGGISGTTKAGFKSWLSGVSGTLGGRFIMDTMAGKGISLADLNTRIDDPNITLSTVSDYPRNYGSISFRGRDQNGNWDYFFNSVYVPGQRSLLIFKYAGTIVYVIEVGCANPIGGLPGLFTTNGIANISNTDAGISLTAGPITAKPGDTLRWKFWIGNQGPDRVFYSNVKRSGFPAATGWNGIYAPEITENTGSGMTRSFGYDMSGRGDYTIYTVTAADVGNTICERTEWVPTSFNNSGASGSNWACATIQEPPVYNLTPSVTTSQSSAIVGQTVNFTYRIQNVQTSGAAANSTGWGVRQVYLPPGVAVPASFSTYKDNSMGCAYFVAAAGGAGLGVTCSEIFQPGGAPAKTKSQAFAKNATTTMDDATMVNQPSAHNDPTFGATVFDSVTIDPGWPPGSHICRVLSLDPRDQAGLQSGETYHNRDAITCVLIASTPYVALVGASSWAGGGAVAPYSGAAGFKGVAGTFGSFGEYGLFATGAVGSFGSGGEYWNTGASSGMNPGTQLTFANTSSFGSYTTSHAISNLATRYATSANNPGVLDGTGHVVGSGVYVDLSGGNMPLTLNSDGNAWAIPAGFPGLAGFHAVIYAPNKTVIIAGDLTYASVGVTSFNQLGSLVVVAKNIKVNGSVQQIAGWFYAINSFVSCFEGPITAGSSATISTTGVCSKRLTVNGSISVANQAPNSLVLNRSFGGQAAGQAAEIIRMRPEVFLTPYEAGNNPSNTLLTTVQETELPARY